MSNEEQLLYALGYCLFMLIVSFIFMKFPPKNINYIYGYRTRRSMENQKIWKVANAYSSKLMIKITLYTLVLPPILYYFSPQNNLVTTVVVHLVLLLFTLYFTEKYLNKGFDNKGNPK